MLKNYTVPKGGGIYIIWLSDTHYYGGRAKNFRTRWARHLRCLLDGTHSNKHIQNVYNKFGVFRPEVVTFMDPHLQLAAEQIWLDVNFGKPGCLNSSRHAEGKRTGDVHSDQTREGMRSRVVSAESRKKISESLKGRKLSDSHRANISAGNLGKTLSEEHRQVLIQSNRDRVWNEEAKKKHSEVHQGQVRSEASLKKQKETWKKNPDNLEKSRASLDQNRKFINFSPEALAIKAEKSAKKLRGKKQTPEHIANASAKRLGSKRSEETKAKMAEAARRRFQREKEEKEKITLG